MLENLLKLWLFGNVIIFIYWIYLVGVTRETENTNHTENDEIFREHKKNLELRRKIGWLFLILIFLFYMVHNTLGITYPWGEHPWQEY